jgi:hypothetical protein
VASGRLVFRLHAVRALAARGITVADVRDVLDSGKTIEDYPTDTPYPSRLVLGWRGPRPLHVVAADNAAAQETIIITVYEPDPARWDASFETRTPRQQP